MQDLLTKGIDENGNIRNEKTHKFKDSPLGRIPEEWEVVRLGEIFNIKAGGDIDKLSYCDIKDKRFQYPIFSNTLENKGLYGYSAKFTYPENCITITGRGTLGHAIPRFEKFNAIIRVLVLIPKFEMNIVFVSEYINNKINFIIESTGVPQLTAPKVAEYYIPLPPLPEQQRIAEILTQIDQTIEKEQQYKEKLQRTKQGLMQDLLTGKVRVNQLVEEEEK
jgi:type I restriction enzyme S subunit